MNERAPTPSFVVIPVDELEKLIRNAVADALAEHDTQRIAPQLLVGPTEMARLVDVSRTTLHRWRKQGCPSIAVGEVFKFEPDRVIAWAREQGTKR